MTQTLPRVPWKTSMRDAPGDRRRPRSVTTGARSRNTTGPDRHSSSDLYNVRLEVYSFMFHILLPDAKGNLTSVVVSYP